MVDFCQKYRPTTLEMMCGQYHLLSPQATFYKLLEKQNLSHSFFYGPPGTGKTTLARIIATVLEMDFYEFNATTIKIEELRKTFKQYENALMKPLVFIDEVHRLSKNQQEVLLPIMERQQALIIGASTENPFYTLTGAIRSRSMLFEFKSVQKQDLERVLELVLTQEELQITKEARAYLVKSSGGDVRAMLNLLSLVASLEDEIQLQTLKDIRPTSLNDGSSDATTHYDLISAMIKSIRGSDEDAATYYLARLIKGGENPEFIARRLVILASEDIGNANPNALNLATSCMMSVAKIGYPEARIILSQTVLYLCASPKSNSAYNAINTAIRAVEEGLILEIPKDIQQNNKNYLYPHDFGGWVKQRYLEKEYKFVEFKPIGFERKMIEWLEKIKQV